MPGPSATLAVGRWCFAGSCRIHGWMRKDREGSFSLHILSFNSIVAPVLGEPRLLVTELCFRSQLIFSSYRILSSGIWPMSMESSAALQATSLLASLKPGTDCFLLPLSTVPCPQRYPMKWMCSLLSVFCKHHSVKKQKEARLVDNVSCKKNCTIKYRLPMSLKYVSYQTLCYKNIIS